MQNDELAAQRQDIRSTLLQGDVCWDDKAEQSHQERCIKRVCRDFSLSYKPVLYEYERQTGSVPLRLTWDCFHAVYPGFPIWLSSSRIKDKTLFGMLPGNFFQSFGKSKLMQSFIELLDNRGNSANGRTAAMIINYPAVAGGLVVHDAPSLFSDGPAWAYKTLRKDRDAPFWVEPFYRALKVWAPVA